MALLFVIQMGLPLGLALWLLLASPYDRLSQSAVIVALALVTSALLLTGVWTVMPWWWAPTCAALGVIGAVRNWRRVERWRPRGWRWTVVGTATSIAALGGWFTVQGLDGRHFPIAPIELAFPLPRGTYIVANGGSNLAVSSHAETLDLAVPRHRLWQGQSYGVDIVALTATGRSSGGWMTHDPRRFAIYARPVMAPCAGSVVVAVDGLPDSPIPLVGDSPSAGNHVLIRCGQADVLLAHFKPGSVAVRPGQWVSVGQSIGEVGNSGSSSEPHLHIHAQSPGTAAAPFSGRPRPIRFDGRAAWRNTRF